MNIFYNSKQTNRSI